MRGFSAGLLHLGQIQERVLGKFCVVQSEKTFLDIINVLCRRLQALGDVGVLHVAADDLHEPSQVISPVRLGSLEACSFILESIMGFCWIPLKS